jgi:hypothetical protein
MIICVINVKKNVVNKSELNETMKLNYKTTQSWKAKLEKKN